MSETTKKTTTRRALMGNAGVAVLAGVAAVAIGTPDAQAVEAVPGAHGPDAELIDLCDRFIELERQKIASHDREPPDLTAEEEQEIDDRERQPIWAKQESLVEAIIEARATTLDGFRARARALVFYDQQGWADEEISHGPFPGGMNFALVRDLAEGFI